MPDNMQKIEPLPLSPWIASLVYQNQTGSPPFAIWAIWHFRLGSDSLTRFWSLTRCRLLNPHSYFNFQASRSPTFGLLPEPHLPNSYLRLHHGPTIVASAHAGNRTRSGVPLVHLELTPRWEPTLDLA